MSFLQQGRKKLQKIFSVWDGRALLRLSGLMVSIQLLTLLLAGCSVLEWQPLSTPSSDSVVAEAHSSAALQTVAGQSVHPFSRWYYDRLTAPQQQVYREMYDLVKAFATEGTLTPTDKEGLDAAFSALCADHPELFWLASYSGSYRSAGDTVLEVTFRPGYSMTAEEAESYTLLLEAERDRILAGWNTEADDYTNVFYLFDTLAQNTVYTEDAVYSQSLVSCLVHRQAVCAGYARALQYLLSSAGLECTYVSGVADGQNHAWNLACLDGEWYYLDPTWGDTDTPLPGGGELLHYEYFTMTTEQLLANHTPERTDWPVCTATKDLYFTREGSALEGWDTVALENLLIQAAGKQAPGVCLSLPDDESFAQACSAVERGDINLILSRVARHAPTLDASALSYYRNDARRVLYLVLQYHA